MCSISARTRGLRFHGSWAGANPTDRATSARPYCSRRVAAEADDGGVVAICAIADERPMKAMLTGPVTILNWSFVRDDIPRTGPAGQIALAIPTRLATSRPPRRDHPDRRAAMGKACRCGKRNGRPISTGGRCFPHLLVPGAR